jgi:hypothetical protein
MQVETPKEKKMEALQSSHTSRISHPKLLMKSPHKAAPSFGEQGCAKQDYCSAAAMDACGGEHPKRNTVRGD